MLDKTNRNLMLTVFTGEFRIFDQVLTTSSSTHGRQGHTFAVKIPFSAKWF